MPTDRPSDRVSGQMDARRIPRKRIPVHGTCGPRLVRKNGTESHSRSHRSQHFVRVADVGRSGRPPFVYPCTEWTERINVDSERFRPIVGPRRWRQNRQQTFRCAETSPISPTRGRFLRWNEMAINVEHNVRAPQGKLSAKRGRA